MQYTHDLAYQRKHCGYKVSVFASQIIFPVPTAMVAAIWNLVFVFLSISLYLHYIMPVIFQ